MEKEKNNENYEVLDESKCDSSSDEFSLFDVILDVASDIVVGGVLFFPVFVEYVKELFEDFGEALYESNLDIWNGDRFLGYFFTLLLTMGTCILTLIWSSIFAGVYSADEAIAFFSNHPSIFKICLAFAFSPTIGIAADIAHTIFTFLGYRLTGLLGAIDMFIEREEDLVKDESKEEELKQEIKNKVVEDKNEVLKQDVISYEKRVQDELFELDCDMGLENNSDHVHTYVNNRFNELYNRICSLSDSAHKNFCLLSLKNAILSYKEEEKKGVSNINDLNATLNYIMSCSNHYSENSVQHKLMK